MHQAEFSGSKSHHDPHSPYYKYHVMRVGRANYCIGCFGTKVFLLLVLPVLTYLFVARTSPLLTTFYDCIIISLLLLPLAFQFLYEIASNKTLYPRLTARAQSTYTLLMHLYIFLTPVSPELQKQKTAILLSIILLLSPQMMIYFYKIITCREFTFRKSKILIRLLFITAYFFTLIYAKVNILGALLLFFIVVLSFYRLRKLSSYRVEGDFTGLSLQLAYVFRKQSLINRFLQNTFLYSPELKKNRSGRVKSIKLAMANVTILLLFMVGILALSKNGGLNQTCRSASAQETETTTSTDCCSDEEGGCCCSSSSEEEEGGCCCSSSSSEEEDSSCCESCCNNEEGNCTCCYGEDNNCCCNNSEGNCSCFYDPENNCHCNCSNSEGNCACFYDEENNCCCNNDTGNCMCFYDSDNKCWCEPGNCSCFTDSEGSCYCNNDQGNCGCFFDEDNKCHCC